jgi:hypothetical protein
MAKNSRLLMTKNHQCLMSNVTNACHKGGSHCRGMVHSVNTALSNASGLHMEDHMHLPLVALAMQWGPLADIKCLSMVVEGVEH